MKKDRITVLLVEPFRTPRVVDIDATLESYQKLVGGYIQCIFPWEEDDQYGTAALVCNEEGKINGSQPNRLLEDQDIIFGTFFITGIDEDDFCSLSPEMAQHYERKFHSPEFFITDENGIIRMKLL